MLSNSLMNAVICTMSNPNPPAHTRKKPPKRFPAPSCNSEHRLKKVSSSTLHAPSTKEGNPENGKLNSVQAMKSGSPSRIDKTTSSANLGRKLWNDAANSFACPAAIQPPTNGIIEEESELIGMLTKQLYTAESEMRKMHTVLVNAENRLRTKEREIDSLKRKARDWEARNRNHEALWKKEQRQRRTQTERSDYLYERCLKLEHRIFEMEKFLADYGLVWVGDAKNSTRPEATVSYIETCYDQLVSNIDQLNLTAGKDEVCIQHSEKGAGASFKTPCCASLKFYKNGMIVDGGALRPYTDASAASFIRDILDGYFPSEMQEAHPNGVPFKVEDHRSETFAGDSVGFPGQGYRLGKQPSTDNASLSAAVRKASEASYRPSRYCAVPKESFRCSEQIAPLATSTARSSKPKSSETPSINMVTLRSQILASHNNICSDTHIQSHINAELGLSSRREKRDVATRNTEVDVFRDKVPRSKPASRLPDVRSTQHRSADRLSSRLSPSRPECTGHRTRRRSRSASLSDSRPSASSAHTVRTSPELKGGSKGFSFSARSDSPNGSRRAKSIARDGSGAPPILHQLNEPNGQANELRLKVRSLNGGTVYLVHISADDSVARLYQLLDRAMPKSWSMGYKIVISGYSPRRLEELELSLRDSGITRDSVLHLVND